MDLQNKSHGRIHPTERLPLCSPRGGNSAPPAPAEARLSRRHRCCRRRAPTPPAAPDDAPQSPTPPPPPPRDAARPRPLGPLSPAGPRPPPLRPANAAQEAAPPRPAPPRRSLGAQSPPGAAGLGGWGVWEGGADEPRRHPPAGTYPRVARHGSAQHGPPALCPVPPTPCEVSRPLESGRPPRMGFAHLGHPVVSVPTGRGSRERHKST